MIEKRIYMKRMQIQPLDDIAISYEKSSTLRKRKDYGQFFTPHDVAKFMVELLFLENRISPESEMILDPAAGLSIFGHIIKQFFGNFNFTAYEIDPEIASISNCQYTNMHIEDYLFAPPFIGKYSKIIANPPYLKHINIPNKKEINAFYSKKINEKIPITSNYYCYFLIKIIEELAPDGKAVIIIPNEIFSSNYGVFYKKLFLKNKFVDKIFFFENNVNVFRDAIASPVILVLRKRENEQIKIQKVVEVTPENLLLSNIKTVYYNDLDPNENWTNYLTCSSKKTCTLGATSKFIDFFEYATIHRGIATGANNFFLFSENERIERSIDKKYFLPCVCSANVLHNLIFTSEYANNLPSDKKTLLLNLTGYTGGDIAIDRYIFDGEKLNFNKKYLTSHRTPWFAMESIDFIGDMFISTFTRSVFKIVINDAKMRNLTCAHAIIFREQYKKFIPFFYAYYQSSLGQRRLSEKSREIGNGLKKIEPSDVTKVTIPNVNIFPQDIFHRIDALIRRYYETRSLALLKEIDILFCRVLDS